MRAEPTKDARFVTVVCGKAWPHFERGETTLFVNALQRQITLAVAAASDPACIVLAQASMAVAEPSLQRLGVAVYSSPRLAVAEALRVAGKL